MSWHWVTSASLPQFSVSIYYLKSLKNIWQTPKCDDCWDDVQGIKLHCCSNNGRGVLGRSIGEEDGYLPYPHPLSSAFEDVVCHIAHGGAQVAFIGRLDQRDALHRLQQLALAPVVLETDQVLCVGAVGYHGNTSTSRTVALSDVDVVQERDERGAHSLEGGKFHIIRHVQGKHQLCGVGWAPRKT